jgi:hypothetical protein
MLFSKQVGAAHSSKKGWNNVNMQDEHAEDAPVPLIIEQQLPIMGHIPQTPALSEQFVFPENLPIFLDNAATLLQPTNSVADGIKHPSNMLLPDQPLMTMQASLIEYGAYPSYPTLPPSVPTMLPPLPPKRKRLNATALIALSLVIVLVLISSCALIFNSAYYRPLQARLAAQATANTANTANTQATSTMNAAATTIGNLDASVTVQSQATALAYQNLYQQATSGTPVLNDALSQQSRNQWDNGTLNDKAACFFKNGSYHASMPNVGFYVPCYENTKSFANFAFQVDMTILNGDRGGVLFRSKSNAGKTYLWDIDTLGFYNLYVYTGFAVSQIQTLLTGFTDALPAGGSQITIIAEGSTLYVYLNQQFITSTTDTTLTAGMVGVLASADQQSTEVAYSNAKVWLL